MNVRILFRPYTVVAGRFRNKYWIGDDIIPQKIIEGASFMDALSSFCTLAEDYGICFSKSALKNKSPMYADDCEGNERQVGYVLPASAEIEGKKVALHIWVNMDEVKDINFKEIRYAS